MNYTLHFTSHQKPPVEIISEAMGFINPRTTEFIIDAFAPHNTSINGVFKSKKAAIKTKERIEARGSFGGFSSYVGVSVVKEG